MENDERFKHLASDPRFKRLRKKQRKVEIDERFQHMFTDERFTLKYSKDKRGQTQRKTTGDELKKYYALKEEIPAEDEEKEDEEVSRNKKHVQDPQQENSEEESRDDDDEDEISNGTTEIDEEQSNEEHSDNDESETNESELSSSSDEAPSDEEELEEGLDDIDRIKYDWQPLDHDADVAESTTKRLAIQNLDWDRVDSKDLFTLVNSIRPPLKVTIYVSEFGRERLKRERLEGPQEIVEMPKEDPEEEEYNMLKSKMEDLKNPRPKALRVNEYEDADEELDPKNEEIRERIRRYQLSRLRYYYAVVEFDSVESAELVYKELDGMEFEGSSLELDLRFIPDDVDFDDNDVKEECNNLPDLTTYKAPQFISTALQQTTVKFTWDETDVRRQEKLHKAYTKEELEKDDLDAYLASETDSDELVDEDVDNLDDSVSVVTANSEARLNKYKLLLRSLEEEENKKKKAEVDVEWDNFDKSDSEEQDSEDELDQEDEEQDSDGSEEPVEDDVELDDKEQDDGELDLLVMDGKNEKRDEFKFDPEDERFKAVYDSAHFNIDPSHPKFKRTQAFDLMAEKKREKRRKTRV